MHPSCQEAQGMKKIYLTAKQVDRIISEPCFFKHVFDFSLQLLASTKKNESQSKMDILPNFWRKK